MGVYRFAILAIGLAIGANSADPSAIRFVDFDNFSYPWSDDSALSVPSTWEWIATAPNAEIRVFDGDHWFCGSGRRPKDTTGCPAVISVNSIAYGDLDGDGVEEAVVALNYSTGGTANWDYLYVYKLEGWKTKLIARMRTGSRADGGAVRVFVRNRLLVVDFADADRRQGDCCSHGYIRVHYRFQDGAFVEASPRERGDLDLKEGPRRPDFHDYRVRKFYRSAPAAPIVTKNTRMFQTVIRRGANRSVEFAGHYTVPRWGCGTGCNGFVIVDSITGRIYDGGAVDELPFQWEDKHGGEAIQRMEFYPNSRLMQINACPGEKRCGLYDYEMIDGKGLKLLRVELLPKEFQPSDAP